jgi:hypothetical protein
MQRPALFFCFSKKHSEKSGRERTPEFYTKEAVMAIKIDFKKYSNPEIASNIADVMSSPQRAPVRIIKWGLVFAVIGVIVDIFLISLSTQPTYIIVLSAIIILFLIAVSGVFLGSYSFFRDLNKSFQVILEYANNVIRLVIKDVCDTFDTFKSGVDGYQIKLPGGNEIVSGVLLDVVNPAAKKCLESRVPLIGKFVSKVYSLAVDGLLKVSSVFFAKVDKEIDKVVNDQLSKVKGVVDAPLNFVENTVKQTWLPNVTEGADRYIGKAKGYIHKTYALISIPILAFAIAFIIAVIVLMIFAV